MRKTLWLIGAAGVLSLASVANATTYTWAFGSDPTQVSNGTTYSGSGGGGTITVFGEQVTNTQDIHGNNTGGTFYSSSDSTIGGLFATDTKYFDEGTGIAPYNPNEGPSRESINGHMVNTFDTQDGITDEVNNNNPTYGNILLLELGSNIASGTTLKFLLQAGNGQAGDAVTMFYSDSGAASGSAQNPTGTTPQNVSPNSAGWTNGGTTPANSITNTSTNPQLTLTKNTNGIEWVAIEADCHYLMLDTITGTPGTSTPEPRFYGMLLAGLLGVAGTLYQRRRAAQANA